MNAAQNTSFQLLLEERGQKGVEALLNKIRTDYPADWARRPHYEELLKYVQRKAGA